MNVSKGEVAKSNDLKKSFGTDDRDTVVREVRLSLVARLGTFQSDLYVSLLLRQILKKGEVQVGDKEREHDIAALRREIATLVAEKCVDPATHAPYSVSIIEKAMTEAGYSVRANKNAKSQVRGTWSRRLAPPRVMHDRSCRRLISRLGIRVYQDAPIGLYPPHRAC